MQETVCEKERCLARKTAAIASSSKRVRARKRKARERERERGWNPSVLLAFPRVTIGPLSVRARNSGDIRASATCPVMNACHKTRMP